MSRIHRYQNISLYSTLSFALFLFLMSHLVSMASGMEPITFKLAHCCSTGGPYHITAEKFAHLVKQYSGGELEARIFPNHQLGNERTMIEGISSGMIQAGVITNAPFGSYQPETMCFDLPFIFRDYAHAHKVLDGPVGMKVLKSLRGIGIEGLAFAEGGFRNIISRVGPIKDPDDLKRIKFRVMETPIYVATFKALGTYPVPMAWGNAFKSLEAGIIDGLEIPIPVMFENRFHEVAKYITMTQHTYSPLVVAVNLKWFNNLSEPQRNLLQQSAVEAARYERAVVEKRETEDLKKLQQEGVSVTRIKDMSPWKSKVEPVYRQYEKILGKSVIEAIASQ